MFFWDDALHQRLDQAMAPNIEPSGLESDFNVLDTWGNVSQMDT
jgi:hypothetical protein